MPDGKLPELGRAEVDAMLARFARRHRRVGDRVVGIARDGSPFAIHLQHGGGLRRDQLSRALRYLAVTREEFFGWYRGR